MTVIPFAGVALLSLAGVIAAMHVWHPDRYAITARAAVALLIALSFLVTVALLAVWL